jgi:integrase
VPSENPVASVTLECENNMRDSVLSGEEFDRLIAGAPKHLSPILLMVYHTGMCKSRLLKLTWEWVDLKVGIIRLRPEDSKTGARRIIPLTKELSETLKNASNLPGCGRASGSLWVHLRR